MPLSEKCPGVSEGYLVEGNERALKGGCLKIVGELSPRSSSLPELEVRGEQCEYVSKLHVYEYIWVLSLIGQAGGGRIMPVEKCLSKKDAILIQVLFHTDGTGFFVGSLGGDLKPPFMIKKSLHDSIIDSFGKISGTAVKLVGAGARMPLIENINASVELINELQKGASPVSHSYPWYSKMFTTVDIDKTTLLDGIEWKIDKKAIRNIGNRLVGSFRLFFIDVSDSQPDCASTEKVGIELRARISLKKEAGLPGHVWIPGEPEQNASFRPLVLNVSPGSREIKK